MSWTLRSQNADYTNGRIIGIYSTKASAKRKMKSLIDFRNEYVESDGKGRMREDYNVHSNWSSRKIRQYWMVENI